MRTRADLWAALVLAWGLGLGVGFGLADLWRVATPSTSRPWTDPPDAVLSIQQLARELADAYPMTAANLLSVAAATSVRDEARLRQLLQRYTSELVRELGLDPREAPDRGHGGRQGREPARE